MFRRLVAVLPMPEVLTTGLRLLTSALLKTLGDSEMLAHYRALQNNYGRFVRHRKKIIVLVDARVSSSSPMS